MDKYQEVVSRYVDGELQLNMEKDLFRHLSSCSHCREFLRDSLELRAYLARTKLKAPARLNTSVGVEKEERRGSIQQDLLVLAWQKRVPLPVAASIGILLLVGGLLMSSFATSEREPRQAQIEMNFPAQFQP